MQSIEKRIEALEQTVATALQERVMFIILVGMGETESEITHIYDNHGNHWHRMPNETEETFKSRATSETPRAPNQVVMLFGEVSSAGVPQE
ncbi:hypothetical protein [Rhodoferax bucti]|uniref:hypothetical protein n=1 Tax=Rhodoferax bucti TaxID=2576305 RepID=UPI001109E732|nr:hypothetical protein [Rhodoferax bucti]